MHEVPIKSWRFPHHQRIQKLLSHFDPEFLLQSGCFFGGGTAITLALDEYRESHDIGLFCSSRDGYRTIRNTIQPSTLGRMLRSPLELAGVVKTGQYGASAVVIVDGVSIKVEFIAECRIELSGWFSPDLGVPVLSRGDMQAEKLLANADRGLDRGEYSRDIIDLAMSILSWGEPNAVVWGKVLAAYGNHVQERYDQARHKVSDPVYLKACLAEMSMDPAHAPEIQRALGCSRHDLTSRSGEMTFDV